MVLWSSMTMMLLMRRMVRRTMMVTFREVHFGGKARAGNIERSWQHPVTLCIGPLASIHSAVHNTPMHNAILHCASLL